MTYQQYNINKADREYQEARAERGRQAQAAQANKPKSNPINGIIQFARKIANSRPQAEAKQAFTIRDTQPTPSAS